MSGIAVEVMPDAGAPQVGITIDGLDAVSSSTITVDVSWDGGDTWHGVRGASQIVVTEATFIRDHVPALGVESTYRLTVVSGATTPATLEATITVTSDTAWIQDPLDPHSAVALAGVRNGNAVMMLSPTAAELARSQPADLVVPMLSDLPVASIGHRQKPAGVPLALRALPAEQGALVKDLRALFDSAGQVVLRGLPADIPLDPVVHVWAGDVREASSQPLGARNYWQLTVTQVAPTSLRIAVPWWTYDQVKALWSGYTYADALAARPGDTYLDWLRDPTVP